MDIISQIRHAEIKVSSGIQPPLYPAISWTYYCERSAWILKSQKPEKSKIRKVSSTWQIQYYKANVKRLKNKKLCTCFLEYEHNEAKNNRSTSHKKFQNNFYLNLYLCFQQIQQHWLPKEYNEPLEI